MNMKNDFLNKRSLKFGSYSVALTAIVIAAVVILNAIVGATQIRDRLKIDLTSQKLYSIGEKTDEVLKELNQDIEIIGLFDENESDQYYNQIVEFVKQYELKSNKIHIRYVDPVKEVAYIQNELDPNGVLGIQKYNYVVKSDKRTKVLSAYDLIEQTTDQNYQMSISGLNAEYAFTGAIRYVAADEVPVIYYTQGHGEGDMSTDYSELKHSIEQHGYDVKPLTLSALEGVPADASVVLITGPQQDLSVQEMERLTTYMENGGDTLLMFDSLELNPQMPNFEVFLAKFNLGLGYDIIFEMAANRYYFNKPYIFMPTVENNDINANLDPDTFNMTVAYTRSIPILQNQKEWITCTPLLTTSAEAEGQALNHDAQNTKGPFNIAVAAENKGNSAPSKTVVIGNALFVTDSGRDSFGATGETFILSALNWMENKETDIFIAAKTYSVPMLENVTQQTMILVPIVLIVVVPLIIFGVGVFIWLRRRHL
ncbi:MAG: GldG family protein [Ruminiclostridium sp.]|nr:GldG family protein [Ruminiclostridium sp.]